MSSVAAAGTRAPTGSARDLAALRRFVQDHCGLRFDDDLAWLVESRLAPRLAAHGLADFGAYHRLVSTPRGSAELEVAVELLTTKETYLAREPHQLRAFRDEVIPRLADRNAGPRRLRVWSAGCATGEEAYTIAALLAGSGHLARWELEVVGSDLVRRLLDVAREGRYGPRAFRTPEAEALRPWFQPDGDRWAVRDALRRLVRFEHLNLLDGAAAARLGSFDAVFCRNVLIYFDVATRRRVVETLAGRLREGGYLMLGHSESLLGTGAPLEPVRLEGDLVYRKPPSSLPGVAP